MNLPSAAKATSLEDLKNRILNTDLVPSRSVLQNDIESVFERLKSSEITNLPDLKASLKTPSKLKTLAQSSGITEEYLTLLRREIESYEPKPFKIKDVMALTEEEIQSLLGQKLVTSNDVHARLCSPGGLTELQNSTGISEEHLKFLFHLSDLARVQWVSLNFAMMLIEAGYESAKKLSEADANELDERLRKVNTNDKFFKGSVGLRDLKRLIFSASYVE